jgi:endo-1,4-beta-xylanase
MHFRSSLVLGIATGLITVCSFGCSPSGGTTGGSGGSTASSSGGHVGTAGASGTGGQVSVGGASGTGGKVGNGGATGTGGMVPGSGGTTESGGKTGSAGAAGGTTSETGGATGLGGNTSNGGAVADAGRRDGGGTRDSGPASAGPDGSTSTGGTSGAGGSTGTPGALKKYFGNIDTGGQIRTDFKSMWDQFSPENAGKWGSVQGGGQSSFSWSSLDAMYKYTQDNGILFKEHCFCWGAQQPSWVNNSNGPAAVQAWMKAFCDRYPKVAMIDVFNESLHNSPAYKDGIGGTGTSGYDWLVNAFKWARAACPNAILLYNDYNTIEYSSENSGVIKLVNAIKGAGGPIDGVGCQGHDVGLVSASTVTTYVNNITSQTGLPVYITEMDVGEADDNTQMTKIKNVVTPLWANDKVAGFTYWGYIVGRTWRSNTGLMTDAGVKRPALTWLMSFLGR